MTHFSMYTVFQCVVDHCILWCCEHLRLVLFCMQHNRMLSPNRGVCIHNHVVPPCKVVGGMISMRFSGPIFLYIHVQDGRTALYVASKNGHDRIIEELLKRQVDLNHQRKVRSLLLCVILQYSSICIVGHF